ncbi:MAG: phosphotransferase [Bryobacteraceae bacterium]
MSTSLAQVDGTILTLQSAAADLLSASVTAMEEVGGGRNSRVYRLRVEPAGSYALKAYFRHASENRARMETEFLSLEFLWKQDIRNIPQPVISSPEHGFAIYSWIEGRRIPAPEVTASSIQAAADFLCQVAELRARPGSESLRPASEACFSGRAIVENLERRLEPLRARSQSAELQSFLSFRLLPALERVSDWSRRLVGDAFERELDLENRTLSPSDFGFHNALETESGKLFFLDLEYFGWDDPAKTICDFLLHPAMAISPPLRRQFAASLLRGLPWSKGLRERVQAYYPLFGLKWCLILLNEFLPEQLLRRSFASGNQHDAPRRQMEQLAKAETMLQTTLSEYEHFPYFD